jgi:eukaryotic-like serine/threonine-protein kinase
MTGRVLADRYVLAEPLGSGGMARVVAATDRLLDRRVAVKLLRADLADEPGVRERLLREARAAASFSHPNAVAVFDVGEDDGTPFIVMELIAGRTLADRLRAEGALPLAEALRIADEVLAALDAAHRRGLVHRDVKPANVLLPDDGGGARLADFGIAKGLRQATAGLTATGQVLGTPRYLSPEQASGRPATARSDLYAVGVLCYELLAGAAPFDGEHPLAIALAHRQDEPPPLGARRPDAPAAVVAAVHRALAKDPRDRFADAAAMRAALADGAAGAAADAATVPIGLDSLLAAPAATTDASGVTTALLLDGDARPGRRVATPAVLALAGLLVVAAAAIGLRGDPAPDEPSLAAVPPAAVVTPTPEPIGAGEPGDAEPQLPTRDEPEGADRDGGGPEPGAAEPQRSGVDEPAVPSGPADADSLDELLAALERDSDAAGAKGNDLRKRLDDLLDERDEDREKKARELAGKVAEWADDDDLDPATAATAARLLAPLTGEGADGRGGTPGRGPAAGARGGPEG